MVAIGRWSDQKNILLLVAFKVLRLFKKRFFQLVKDLGFLRIKVKGEYTILFSKNERAIETILRVFLKEELHCYLVENFHVFQVDLFISHEINYIITHFGKIIDEQLIRKLFWGKEIFSTYYGDTRFIFADLDCDDFVGFSTGRF